MMINHWILGYTVFRQTHFICPVLSRSIRIQKTCPLCPLFLGHHFASQSSSERKLWLRALSNLKARCWWTWVGCGDLNRNNGKVGKVDILGLIMKVMNHGLFFGWMGRTLHVFHVWPCLTHTVEVKLQNKAPEPTQDELGSLVGKRNIEFAASHLLSFLCEPNKNALKALTSYVHTRPQNSIIYILYVRVWWHIILNY